MLVCSVLDSLMMRCHSEDHQARVVGLHLGTQHITVADKVNIVSICNVLWHIGVFSRALWQAMSQIAKGSFQVDYKEYR